MVIFEVTFAKLHYGYLCVLCKQNELPMRADFKCPLPRTLQVLGREILNASLPYYGGTGPKFRGFHKRGLQPTPLVEPTKT